MRYTRTPGGEGSGVGLHERQLHQASGLRNTSLNAVISTDFSGICPLIGIGSAAGTGYTDWGGPDYGAGRLASMKTALTAGYGITWTGHLPVPMTPTIYLVAFGLAVPTFAASGTGEATQVVRFRVRGIDQFGEPLEEITPPITLNIYGRNTAAGGPSGTLAEVEYLFAIHLSKVFSYVADVEYMNYDAFLVGTGAQATWHLGYGAPLGAYFSIGWSTVIDPPANGADTYCLIDPDGVSSGPGTFYLSSVQVRGVDNWGIGTPHRVAPYGKAIPFANPEITGAHFVLLRERTGPSVLNTVARAPVQNQRLAGALPEAGITLGKSESGWQGDPHKLSVYSDDSWATKKIAGITLTGSSTRTGDYPAARAQIGEDELMVNVFLRTSLGTRRDSNPQKSYLD